MKKIKIAILAILVISLLALRYIYLDNKFQDVLIVEYDSIYNQFNTGDIIFFRRNHWNDAQYNIIRSTLHHLIFPNISGVVYTHVGIIIKINNIPYLYQLTIDKIRDIRTNTFTKEIPTLGNIKDYIMTYKGDIYYYKYNNSISLSDVDILNVLEEYKETKLARIDRHPLHFINHLLDKKPIDELTCSELIHYIIHKITIIPEDNKLSRFPKDILKLIKNSNLYQLPVRIKN